jgi:cytochrome c-type biogenesis protein CcmH
VNARRSTTGVLVALAVFAAVVTLAVVAMRGQRPALTQAQQVQQIAASLHCPICKDLSVADSPAPLAQQMRAQIAQRLAAGETPDQIRAGFVAAYGDSVLMAPPRHGLGSAAYYLPVLVVLLGLVLVTVLLRRWRRPGATDDLPEVSAAQRRALQRAVERLRDEEPG